MAKAKDTTFIKITNKDIYHEIVSIKEKIDVTQKQNNIEHGQIIRRLDLTNGKVKRSLWVATTALTITLIVLGYLFQHINNLN